jgi:RNA polymerase sigma-70 factor (sigma-E family)
MSPDEERQFHDFVAARRPALVRTAFLLCGDPDEAHDLVQTALMRMHRRWRGIERADAPEVYARRVIVNLAASWWRSRLRHRWVPLSDLSHPSTPDASEQVADRDALWHAVMGLPPRTRAVLVLRYFEDLTEADTARALECSVGSVKSQASRGLGRLREQFANDVGPLASTTPAEVQS